MKPVQRNPFGLRVSTILTFGQSSHTLPVVTEYDDMCSLDQGSRVGQVNVLNWQ